ncbi:MAG: metallophosphoesterase [Planctomycetota bacterium]|nr:metallophosphoesterase [Planctomycetota bacterium]
MNRIVLAMLLAAGLTSCAAPPVDTKPFTVVMLPDTQYYSAKFPATFAAQTRWVRENAGKENIVFVTQVGDIVDNVKAPEQWQAADAGMSLLDGALPYGVAIGNHDYDDLDKQASPTFASHFGPKRFAGRSWYGGGTEDGQCSVQFFQGAGRRFMVLHLPFEGSEKALAWAREIIAKNPGVPTIVSTHCYLCPGGTPFPDNPAAGRLGIKAVKDKLIDKCPQIFLVLSGHCPAEKPEHRMDANAAGGKVVSLLADYQFLPDGGQGWLVLLTFDPAKEALTVRTYSPTLNKDLPGPGGLFTLPWPDSLKALAPAAS